ncbi:MAG: class I SAM-dependent methyltransferase [Thermodesulfovibrio sp.]|nr:class I SAM-dependent methyltransferase [Thermodesulfovibrio sp.]
MANYRGWEYATKGEYHKNLDPDWSYTPTYLLKMAFVRSFLDRLPKNSKILDAGCGEGVLVEEYRAKGYNIEGIDLNYQSEIVRRGNLLDMWFYSDDSFDVVLLLDVFEHLSFADQPKALAEIKRVLKHEGILVASIPNLAHLNSRIKFFLNGKLDRTDCELNHIGERPFSENLKLIQESGFDVAKVKGITLTLPPLINIIRRKPSWFRWLHNILQVFALPSLSMLNIYICRNIKP